MNSPTIRPFQDGDWKVVTKLHQDQLSDEFITKFGRRFLRYYYRAFADSPYAVALIAIEPTRNQVVGSLMGTLDSAKHYRYMIQSYGLKFALHILLQSILRPTLAWKLVVTRGRRYIKGIMRYAFSRKNPPHQSEVAGEAGDKGGAEVSNVANGAASDAGVAYVEIVADLTHLVVDESVRSGGIGSSLVRAFEEQARLFGVTRIDLVTLPPSEHGAGPFYEKLGWATVGLSTSASGERFVLYRKSLS